MDQPRGRGAISKSSTDGGGIRQASKNADKDVAEIAKVLSTLDVKGESAVPLMVNAAVQTLESDFHEKSSDGVKRRRPRNRRRKKRAFQENQAASSDQRAPDEGTASVSSVQPRKSPLPKRRFPATSAQPNVTGPKAKSAPIKQHNSAGKKTPIRQPYQRHYAHYGVDPSMEHQDDFLMNPNLEDLRDDDHDDFLMDPYLEGF
ncbi:uncharacterized protein LOC132195998 [Neocloeon triangulifer]|uniref:uncharacterized protein LOC132195998 n=1 Tax=Neocloeon triangulifer TaxID=2078957 RepID=UPI00286F9D24|nr:uncharacterized protein LOC132195998 [Neocloeon triangulifer]